jgi:hypothetical protein
VIYDDPYGRFWKRHLTSGQFAPASATISPGYPWVEPDLPEAEARPIAELPLMHHFTGWGTVIMRGGWGEDDIYASFRIGDHYWSHQHADAGAFTIYRRGALAIDSGTYQSGYRAEHHYMYAMQAIAHNTVLVRDPRDYYPDFKATVFVAPNQEAILPYPNDGGQRRVGSGGHNYSPDDIDAWRAEIDDYEFGNITLVAHGSDYTVAAGDLDAAYNNRNSGTGDATDRTRRVKDFQRYFVYLRPGYFAVFDRIEAYAADFEKTWLVHAINEPDIDDDQITITRADTVKHRWTWGDLEHRQQDRSLYRYDGRLFVKTVLPRQAQITKIGGDGRQFWIDGRNYDGSRNRGGVKWMTAPPTEGPPEPGAWRVEVSPHGRQAKDLFLHVLYPTLATTRAMPAVRSIQADAGGMTGAHVAANFENPQWLVLFNSSVGSVDSVSYSLQGEGRCKQLLTDMVPGKRYTVTQNGKPVTAVAADDQGIVFFVAELTGTDTFELD